MVFKPFLFQLAQSFLDALDSFNDVLVACCIAHAETVWITECVTTYGGYMCFLLLEDAHVATVGGDAFGDPDCFRMSYATSDENIKEAIRRIKEALSKLK